MENTQNNKVKDKDVLPFKVNYVHHNFHLILDVILWIFDLDSWIFDLDPWILDLDQWILDFDPMIFYLDL